VGPRAGLDRCGKAHPPPGFDSLTVHPVASRYTECAIVYTRSLTVGCYGHVCKFFGFPLPCILRIVPFQILIINLQKFSFFILPYYKICVFRIL
jgi:hypothetical protein